MFEITKLSGKYQLKTTKQSHLKFTYIKVHSLYRHHTEHQSIALFGHKGCLSDSELWNQTMIKFKTFETCLDLKKCTLWNVSDYFDEATLIETFKKERLTDNIRGNIVLTPF